MTDDPLLTFLRRPALARLWPMVRQRVERLGGVRGSVRLEEAQPGERRALADLLALSTVPRGEEVQVHLRRLDEALRASRFAVGLEEALERLGGPLRNHPRERAAAERRRRELWREAEDHPAAAAHPGLAAWLDGLAASGLLHRLAREDGDPRRLLHRGLDVLAALPAGSGSGSASEEPVLLQELAGRVLGSSHALDDRRPEATLVLHALAALGGDEGLPADAAGRRALWQRHGVSTDDLSTDVLALGLRPGGDTPVAAALRLLAEAGEPARLTLRQLTRGQPGADPGGNPGANPGAEPLRFPSAPQVFVCENPAVVAAVADRLSAAPPLLCVAGYPNLAARRLLHLLARSGAVVLYHGDFDWSGLQIANLVHGMVTGAAGGSFRPWRFTAADYRRAVGRAPGPPLAGEPVAAAWDPSLSAVMERWGQAVEEEGVLDDLLSDLSAHLREGPRVR